MKVKVLGFREMSFTTSDGNKLEGTSLHYCYPMGSDGVGEESGKTFLSKSSGITAANLKPGSIYNFDFSNKGKLVGVYEAK